MGSAKSRGLVLFSILAVLASDAVRAWDLGVVTRTQIQLLKQKVVENTAADQLKDMVAAAYDPVRKTIYVSDSNTKSGSIFRIRTVGDLAFVGVEPIVTKQTDAVQGIAFDDRTYTLYWTTGSGHTINYLRVPENGTKGPLPGHVLLTFKREIPQGIAIDSCRGYLYWTNIYHLNATIERSRLDGTDRQVIVHENLFQPLGIAVDMEQDLLYWTNEREGLYYSIESSDLNGGSRKTLIQGTHHQPFSIALDDQNLYWSDWTNNAVYMLPKSSFQDGGRPEVYEKVSSPMGLISKSGNMTFINETYCAINRSEDIVMPTEPTPKLIPYDVLRNFCKNNGVLHANGTCTCAIGFAGEYCQTAVCDGYCVTGTCTVDVSSGQPKCRCPDSSGSYGDRCEKQLCAETCQNGGECVLDIAHDPRCKCPAGYVGDACQFKPSWLTDLCSVYCKHAVSEPQQLSVCRCDNYDYRRVEPIFSDISPCKLSKGIIAVLIILTMFVASLGTVTMVLAKKVRTLGRLPRIKKRIVVNKSITPLTSCRPPQEQNQQQCEITIENCCNMNICETPCFEPDFRPQKQHVGGLLKSKSKKEDKFNLLSNTDMTSSEDEKPVY